MYYMKVYIICITVERALYRDASWAACVLEGVEATLLYMNYSYVNYASLVNST